MNPDEIVAQTPKGIYVAQLGGGQVNTATGDFVFGMTEAYLIEAGRITEPLRNANLIGNGPDVLAKIDAIGNDFDMSPGTCGKDGQNVAVGCGQPTMRLSGVTIGGTAECLSYWPWRTGCSNRHALMRTSRCMPLTAKKPPSGCSKARSKS